MGSWGTTGLQEGKEAFKALWPQKYSYINQPNRLGDMELLSPDQWGARRDRSQGQQGWDSVLSQGAMYNGMGKAQLGWDGGRKKDPTVFR